MARTIVITSGKGGVGKTTLTANLGIALTNLGARVLLVDVDFGLNNLDVVLGLEHNVIYDINDVFEGRCRPKQALLCSESHKNLYVLPSNSLKSEGYMLSGQNLKVIINALSPMFDYVLLDCPAGIDIGFHRAVASANEAIVVTTLNLSSLRDADKVIAILNSYKLNKISLVANKVRGDLVLSNKMVSPLDVESYLKTPLIGVIPEDDNVFLSVGGVAVNSRSGKAYKILGSNVHNGSKKIYDALTRYAGFFGSIRRNLKKSL